MKFKRWTLGLSITLLAASTSLVACSQRDAAPPATSATASTTASSTPAAAVVAPPPGDATPKPVDAADRTAATANDKVGGSDHPSTVGTAAAGAPPYTLNSAPEGNQGPSQDPNAGANKK